MNDPTQPGHGRPTVAEIAALTRRLSELSTPDRAVDPQERAAFLADKDALLARITDTEQRTDPTAAGEAGEVHRHDARPDPTAREAGPGWWARADSSDPAIPAATFDAGGYYSDAQLAAIADARAAGDNEHAERLQERPWITPPAAETAPAYDVDDTRRDQLARWHADDLIVTDVGVAVEHGADADGPADGDGAGWDR